MGGGGGWLSEFIGLLINLGLQPAVRMSCAVFFFVLPFNFSFTRNALTLSLHSSRSVHFLYTHVFVKEGQKTIWPHWIDNLYSSTDLKWHPGTISSPPVQMNSFHFVKRHLNNSPEKNMFVCVYVCLGSVFYFKRLKGIQKPTVRYFPWSGGVSIYSTTQNNFLLPNNAPLMPAASPYLQLLTLTERVYLYVATRFNKNTHTILINSNPVLLKFLTVE